MSSAGGPRCDEEIPAYLDALGLPGLADVHVHFHPDRLMARIWAFFDEGERHYGVPWPIHYRTSQEERLQTLSGLGVRRVPALTYAHKPGMAAGLNGWCAEFADTHPQVLRCATLYPEPGVTEYVDAAVRGGVQLPILFQFRYEVLLQLGFHFYPAMQILQGQSYQFFRNYLQGIY